MLLLFVSSMIAHNCFAQYQEVKQPDSLFRINKVKLRYIYFKMILTITTNQNLDFKVLDTKDTFDINGNLIKAVGFHVMSIRPEPSSTTENKYDSGNKLIYSKKYNIKENSGVVPNIENSTTPNSNMKPSSQTLQTIDTYEYDKDNNLILRHSFDSLADGTTENETEEYQYDENKRIVKCLSNPLLGY